MKFKNIKTDGDGYNFDVECSNQEVSYLVNWAVDRLMQEGVISVNSYPSSQEVQLRESAH